MLAPNIFQAVNTPPSILSVSPANGPAGTLVTITGINLSTAVTVAVQRRACAVPRGFGQRADGHSPGGRYHRAGGRPHRGRDGGFSRGNFTLTASVATPVITSAASASGQVDSLFNYQITATNGPVSYGAAGLPPGVGVNPATGLISGVPTAPGDVRGDDCRG